MPTFNPFRFYNRFVLLVLLLVLVAPVTAAADEVLAGVDLILIVEVTDTAGWVALHDQVLRTADPATKLLGVGIARDNPRRSIAVSEPRFTVSVMKGFRSFTVTITGKVAGGQAAGGLVAFEHAVADSQGSAESEIQLSYGLSSVAAQIIEMHLTRP